MHNKETREGNPTASGPGQEGNCAPGRPQVGGFCPSWLYLPILILLSIT